MGWLRKARTALHLATSIVSVDRRIRELEKEHDLLRQRVVALEGEIREMLGYLNATDRLIEAQVRVAVLERLGGDKPNGSG